MAFVRLSQTIEDGAGFDWDIQSDGRINDGENDAFDGAFDWRDFGSVSVAETTDAGLELPRTIDVFDELILERAIFVSPTSNWIRYFDTVTNFGASTITYEYDLTFDFGTDGSTAVATSSGDTIVSGLDQWLAVSSNDPANTDTLAGVLFGDGTLAPDLSFSFDDLSLTYSVTLAPGQSASFLTFGVQDNVASGVETRLESLSNPGFSALSGLDGVDLDQIVNWDFANHTLDLTGQPTHKTRSTV